MLFALLLFSTLFLSYNNGANDNFKGVATLYGSGILAYKPAIIMATLFTFLGSISALFLANGLVNSFSGKGLIPQDMAASTDFLIAVSFGAALTVLVATRLGFPISTTHSLVGGLLGAGLMAVGMEVNFNQLASAFFLPLLVSPFIAVALGMALYWLFTHVRQYFALTKETCICIGEQTQPVPVQSLNASQAKNILANSSPAFQNNSYNPVQTKLLIADSEECSNLYTGKVWGLQLQRALNFFHILSAGAVSFARGLNDTPKITGLLVAANLFDIRYGLFLVGIFMAVGGLLNARAVAETMSKKITQINHGQGLSANLVTSFLVIVASKFGIPVSTTHVSVGALFGISMVSKSQNNKVIKSILLSWLITLPVAMIFSAIIFALIG